jgi:hypothetical protein
MVVFGEYRLPHALQATVQDSRIIHDRLIPSASVGHRTDETAGGRIIMVSGEIRDDPDYVLRLEEMRVKADDTARTLDLEDGSAAINAKLGTIVASWTVEDGLERPTYAATFYETS